jgi:hypothetical protein
MKVARSQEIGYRRNNIGPGMRGRSIPLLAEIEATVARMELRHANSIHFAAYRDLCRRFEADLSDARDLALAKSAPLMLIKALDEGPGA